jgi:putative addiction module component (TIGR02574 family)
MGDAARRLTDQALALPEDEREAIALELMASLGDGDDEWESAWASEIDRRVAELRSGAVALRPWSDVKSDLLARLQQK